MLLLFVSCQAKEGTSGGLFSDHLATTNKFTVQSPTAKTYVETETITFNVSFPFDIVSNTTGGNPRLRITVGATTRYATYVVQANPRLLQFTYTIVAGENDTDGITVNALELNGSILQFDNQGVLTNCDVTTVTASTFSTVKVDTAGPTVTALNVSNLPGLYRLGSEIIFTVTFSETVVVTGTPKMVVSLTTGGAVDAQYLSGSGSKILSFAFTITSAHVDTDGYVITNAIDVAAGTIKDAYGNAANASLAAYVAAAQTYSASVDINGQVPFITAVTVPANGTYLAAQTLDFVLTFNRAVNVTGTPYIALTIGSTPKQAAYYSGTGTTQLTFRYTTVPGDVDTDGITLANTITQNTGTIAGAVFPTVTYFNGTNNLYTVPSTTGIIISSIQPAAVSVVKNLDTTTHTWTGATDNVWNIGQQLDITVNFNTTMIVTQTNGTPYIPLTIGATSRNADYLSGGDGQTALIFRYVIQEGDLDSDGSIGIGTIVLNGGVITDTSNTNATLTLPSASLTTTYVDGIRPTITNVAKPVDATYSTVTPYSQAELDFTVTWSEAVNYSATGAGAAYLPMTIGAAAVRADYASGNNTATIIHTPTSLAGQNDTDGIALSSPFAGTATVKDSAGNAANVLTYTPPVTTGIIVDTTAPTVTSVVAVTPSGTYGVGETLSFTVTFSEPVETNVNGGYPYIPVTFQNATRYLLPATSTFSTTHTFSYTIVSGDLDTDGIVLTNAVTSNGATAYARDAGRNNVTGTFTLPNTTGILVDGVGPTISSKTPSSNGTYTSGDTLQISVTFNEVVTVNTAGGTPYIAVDFTDGVDNFDYASGSGTTTLVFSKLLDTTHFDMDGLPASIASITLNGGTIQDAKNNNATLTFSPVVNLSGVKVTYSQVKLWTNTDFVNLAPVGGATVTNTGANETESCGTGLCRSFNGNDSLSVNGAMNNIETVFMAIKMPATPVLDGVSFDIFDADVQVVGDATDTFDLATSGGADISIDNGLPTNGVNHNRNLSPGATHIFQIDFAAPKTFNTTLIESAFNGAVGEVIAVETGLTPAQMTNLYNYMNARY